MKAVIGLVVLAALVGAIYFGQVWMASDEGKYFGMAFGAPQDGQVEVHVALMPLMKAEDPPPPRVIIDWAAWANDHFTITDPSGMTVPATANIQSNLITELQSGPADTYLIWKLTPGQKYTFAFMPVAGQPRRYTCTITAPQAAEPFRRVNCNLVK